MLGRTTLIALASAAALTAVSAAPSAPVLRSVTVEFPVDEPPFPGGAEAEPINNNCLACHSAGMILTQPALSKAAWEAEVNKMINVFKAPVSEADIPPIVAYLMQTKGAK